MARRSRLDRDLDDEIQSHLGLRIDDNRRAGMTPDEARRHAIVALGGVEAVKELYRERRGFPALDDVRDCRLRRERQVSGHGDWRHRQKPGPAFALFGPGDAPAVGARPHDGLLSYVVSVRGKEIGVRAVLGAVPSAIVRLMVRQSAVPVGIGLAGGVGIAVAAGVILRSLIYGSPPIDPAAPAGASAVLVLVMCIWAALQVRQARRV